jgi:hypothetical protein
LQEHVLALVCSSTTDFRTVCRALRTSKAAAAAILDKGSRQLSIHLRWESCRNGDWRKGRELQVLAERCSWVAKYGASLVRGMTVEIPEGLTENAEPGEHHKRHGSYMLLWLVNQKNGYV